MFSRLKWDLSSCRSWISDGPCRHAEFQMEKVKIRFSLNSIVLYGLLCQLNTTKYGRKLISLYEIFIKCIKCVRYSLWTSCFWEFHADSLLAVAKIFHRVFYELQFNGMHTIERIFHQFVTEKASFYWTAHEFDLFFFFISSVNFFLQRIRKSFPAELNLVGTLVFFFVIHSHLFATLGVN